MDAKPQIASEAEDDPEAVLLAAFERREAERIESDFEMLCGKATGVSPAQADAGRVAALIAADQAYRAAEQDRKQAEIEVRAGVFVNLADTVVPPTPEWLAKGETRSFTPKLIGEGGRTPTVKTVKTVRRVATPIVLRMHHAGNLTDDQYAACRWYAERHEAAALDGRYKFSNISFTSGTSGGDGNGQAPMALYLREAQARVQFRKARETIPAFYLRFFEAIVLNDVPLRRAVRFARCRTEKGPVRFRECCHGLVAHLAAIKAKMVDDDEPY